MSRRRPVEASHEGPLPFALMWCAFVLLACGFALLWMREAGPDDLSASQRENAEMQRDNIQIR